VLLKWVSKIKIQSYIPRTHEMKNGKLSKSKGCLSFLLPKIYQLPEYYMMFVRKILLPNLGGTATAPLPPSPTPMSKR